MVTSGFEIKAIVFGNSQYAATVINILPHVQFIPEQASAVILTIMYLSLSDIGKMTKTTI